jgi:hypothetical protein
MSRYYTCDREGCGHAQIDPTAYRLSRLTEPEDDDEHGGDEYDCDVYHFCTTRCLALFVMELPLDDVTEVEPIEGES